MIRVKILRKCALRGTTKRRMHARRIDDARTGGCTRRPVTANPVPRSMPLSPEVGTPHSHTGASLNAVSAFALSPHEPAIAAAIFDADLKRLEQLTASKPRGHSSTAPLLSCRERLSRRPRCAPSTRTWPSHILVGLSFNALVHYVAGDRALTSRAADRRKTKPSDREARARPGDRDQPTPKDTAERSARA